MNYYLIFSSWLQIMNSQFKLFIQDQLSRAKINKKYSEKLTEPSCLKIFEHAFTHESHNSDDNYEIYEYIGDSIIHGIITQYLIKRLPGLKFSKKKPGQKNNNKNTNEGIASKLRSYIEKKRGLQSFALKLGFKDYIIENDPDVRTKNLVSTLEDVFEAFIGALVTVIDNNIARGLGYLYAYNYTETLLDELILPNTLEELDSYITILGELFKASSDDIHNGFSLGWNSPKFFEKEIIIPKLKLAPTKPPPINGDTYMNTTDNTVYSFINNNWVRIENVDSMISAYTHYTQKHDPENHKRILNEQRIWLMCVKGEEKTIDNMGNEYKIDSIMGIGISFTKQVAKELAAERLYNKLKKLGYYKTKITEPLFN